MGHLQTLATRAKKLLDSPKPHQVRYDVMEFVRWDFGGSMKISPTQFAMRSFIVEIKDGVEVHRMSITTGPDRKTRSAAMRDRKRVEARTNEILSVCRSDEPDQKELARAFEQGRVASSTDRMICGNGTVEQLAVCPYPPLSRLAERWENGYRHQSVMECG